MRELKGKTGRMYKFYETSKEMPIRVWNDFLSYMIQNSELGPDFSTAQHKLSRLDELIAKGRVEDFNVERQNLQIQLFYIFNAVDPRGFALLQLCHSIDGERIDRTDKKLLDKLLEDEIFTVELVEDLLEDTRKK